LEVAVTNKFEDPEQQLHFIRKALANVNRMSSLIEDLVLLSNLDQGTLSTIRQEIDPQIDIEMLIEKTLDGYEDKNLNVEIVKDIQVDIHAPRVEFKRALFHLFSNACKFSPEGGRVAVQIEANESDGCRVTIQDEGSGIPVEYREKVFERFYQISQGDSRDYEGLGVGLTIARAIAESLGGTVQIMDMRAGCKVSMTIPPGVNEWSNK
jgi:signal transduction histidine kinase